MNNILAHTEASGSNPAYLSVNERDGGVEVSVRTRGAQNASVIRLTADEWFHLVARAAVASARIPPLPGELS